ncbi:hypothetical protein GCM10018965_019050 [Nonomuraea roseola]
MNQPPDDAATLALPPYSGLEPICPTCGWIGATLQYREARGAVALPWNSSHIVDGPRPERLARHCTSCGYHWDAAPLDTPPTIASALGNAERPRRW